MPEETLTSQQVSGLGVATRVTRPPDVGLLANQLEANWPIIGAAIALAGGAYPIVLSLGFSFVVIAKFLNLPFAGGLGPASDVGEGVLSMFLSMFFGCTAGAFMGFFLAGIACLAILPLVYLFVLSLKLRGRIVWFGAFCGGLVGFVAVMALLIGFVSDGLDLLGWVVILAIGPALTTVIGQFGGAWGGYRVQWYERAMARAAIGEGGQTPPHRVQFGIRHMMVVCMWMALLLTAIRLSGLDYVFAMLLLSGWLAYQAATLWIGGLLVSWFVRWKARRKSRST